MTKSEIKIIVLSKITKNNLNFALDEFMTYMYNAYTQAKLQNKPQYCNDIVKGSLSFFVAEHTSQWNFDVKKN